MLTLLRQTLDLVYPPTCPLCADRLPEGQALPLCDACARALPRQHTLFCRPCGDSLHGQWDLAAPFQFSGGIREALHLVKYQGRRRLAAQVAAVLCAFARRHLLDQSFTVVVPVPLHWRRLWQRGFNQAEWFAAPVAEELGVPLQTAWLTRRRATPSQTGYTRRERLANLEGAFAITAKAGAQLAGARVLLVDDVVTTGATADACARVLRDAGAARVTVLAVAHTPRVDA